LFFLLQVDVKISPGTHASEEAGMCLFYALLEILYMLNWTLFQIQTDIFQLFHNLDKYTPYWPYIWEGELFAMSKFTVVQYKNELGHIKRIVVYKYSCSYIVVLRTGSI